MSDKQSDKQPDKPAIPDWVQYVIGAVVSIVLVIGYLQLTSEPVTREPEQVTEDDTGE